MQTLLRIYTNKLKRLRKQCTVPVCFYKTPFFDVYKYLVVYKWPYLAWTSRPYLAWTSRQQQEIAIYYWLVRLGMDLATVCDMLSSEQSQLIPFGHFQVFHMELFTTT